MNKLMKYGIALNTVALGVAGAMVSGNFAYETLENIKQIYEIANGSGVEYNNVQLIGESLKLGALSLASIILPISMGVNVKEILKKDFGKRKKSLENPLNLK